MEALSVSDDRRNATPAEAHLIHELVECAIHIEALLCAAFSEQVSSLFCECLPFFCGDYSCRFLPMREHSWSVSSIAPHVCLRALLTLSTLLPTMIFTTSGLVEKVSSSLNHVGSPWNVSRTVTSYTIVRRRDSDVFRLGGTKACDAGYLPIITPCAPL